MLDMAIDVVVGAALGASSAPFVSDLMKPPIGLISGGHSDMGQVVVDLSGHAYATLAEARAAGAATINYGLFLNAAFDFLFVALAVFLSSGR